MEVIHTVLLGPYKYLTGKVMSTLSKNHKTELSAVIDLLDYSGINGRMSSNVKTYSQSFVGRNFKVWAQIAPFVLQPSVDQQQLNLWISLSKVSLFILKVCKMHLNVRYNYYYYYSCSCIIVFMLGISVVLLPNHQSK